MVVKYASKFWLPGVAAVLVLAASHPASAGYNYRSIRQKAVASCQAPLPVYDKQLRKRPGGIVNESSVPVYVACGLPTNVFADTRQVDVQFTNLSNTPVTIVCTLATGDNTAGATSYVQSLMIPTASWSAITFDALEYNDDQPFEDDAGLSYKLPPNVELNSTGVTFYEWSN